MCRLCHFEHGSNVHLYVQRKSKNEKVRTGQQQQQQQKKRDQKSGSHLCLCIIPTFICWILTFTPNHQ